MIRTITGNRYINVQGGSPSNPYISPGAVGAGMLRWNSNINSIEVNDGMSWKTLNQDYTTLSLTPDAEAAIDWVRKKMDEERDLEELCKRFPGLKKARDNFEMFRKLAESALKETNDGSTVSTSP